jgi:hypothetical protein
MVAGMRGLMGWMDSGPPHAAHAYQLYAAKASVVGWCAVCGQGSALVTPASYTLLHNLLDRVLLLILILLLPLPLPLPPLLLLALMPAHTAVISWHP